MTHIPDEAVQAKRHLIQSYDWFFKSTGVDAIDDILSSIADAAESYHNTSQWKDEGHIDRIQKYADVAAAHLSAPCAVEVVRFGKGEICVSTGEYYGDPAVLIYPSKSVGIVGANVPKDQQRGEGDLTAGELAFTFPTHEQAKIVADALCNVVTKPVDVTAWAKDLLSIWDQWICCVRSDVAAKEQADLLLRSACFAAQAYEDAISAPITADSAPAVLMRTFFIALIDQNSPDLDPYRAKNRPQTATVTHDGTMPVGVAAVQNGKHSDIIERLNGDIAQLLRMIEQVKMAGAETGVRVKSPELLVKDLSDAASAIRALSPTEPVGRAALAQGGQNNG